MGKTRARQTRLGLARALSDDLAALAQHWPDAMAPQDRQQLDDLRDRLNDGLLPRLEQDPPEPLVVLMGPTGVGKSLVINSLSGIPVTPPGTLRPTTRQPVAVGPSKRPPPAVAALHWQTANLTTTWLVELPDTAQVKARVRQRVSQLIRAADAFLLVVSALRYGDGVVWQIIDQLVAAQSEWALVVNRCPPNDLPAIRNDVQRRLKKRSSQPVHFIEETKRPANSLPNQAAQLLQTWFGNWLPPVLRQERLERLLTGIEAALASDLVDLSNTTQALGQRFELIKTALTRAEQPQPVDTTVNSATIAALESAWAAGNYQNLAELAGQTVDGLLEATCQQTYRHLTKQVSGVQFADISLVLPTGFLKQIQTEAHLAWLRQLGQLAGQVPSAPLPLVEALKLASLGASTRGLRQMAGAQAEELAGLAQQKLVEMLNQVRQKVITQADVAASQIDFRQASQNLRQHASQFRNLASLTEAASRPAAAADAAPHPDDAASSPTDAPPSSLPPADPPSPTDAPPSPTDAPPHPDDAASHPADAAPSSLPPADPPPSPDDTPAAAADAPPSPTDAPPAPGELDKTADGGDDIGNQNKVMDGEQAEESA
jgi:tRNA U34 5-carboxymethylaminomethyl modifying GTPase MnmE/TrmE